MYCEQCTIFTPSALDSTKDRTTSTSTTVTSFKSKINRGSAMLELLFQFPDVLRLKVTNQTNRCLSTLRIPFNLQGPPASIGASIIFG